MGIITYIQHLGGHRPLKIWENKNVQNSGQFMTTFNFDRLYLKNRSIYRKRETNFIESNSCCVEQKILVNLCALIKKL